MPTRNKNFPARRKGPMRKGPKGVKALVKRVRILEIRDKPEIKYQTISLNDSVGAVSGNTPSANNPGYYITGPLGMCGGGTSDSERIGEKTRLNFMYFKGTIIPQTGYLSSATIEFQIIRWNKYAQANTAFPMTQFLNLQAYYGQVTTQTFRVEDGMSDFVIVRRHKIKVPPPQFSTELNTVPFQFGLKCRQPNSRVKDWIMTYQGPSSTVDLSDGAYYILVTCSVGNKSSLATIAVGGTNAGVLAANTGYNMALSWNIGYTDV